MDFDNHFEIPLTQLNLMIEIRMFSINKFEIHINCQLMHYI